MKKHKKIFNIFISSTIIISTFLITDSNKISAEGSADYTYATDTLSENSIFTNIDSQGNVTLMSEEELKASGIVEITPPISFFSARTIVNTEDILTQRGVVNFRTKDSSSKNTLYEEADTGKEGYTNGYYAADAAYLGHNEDKTKVKFMLGGVIGWVDADDVQVLDFSDPAIQTLSKYFVKNGRLYHGIVTNLNSSSYSSELDVGPKPSYLKENGVYYSYDGHYFYDYNNTQGYITMLNDYRNDTRENSVNKDSPYYNYYQYLPHRSITAYSDEELNKAIDSLVKTSENRKNVESKMRNLGVSLIENQNKHGINALLTLGIAANESAWGCSNIAQSKNNLFGHAAYDSDPNGNSNMYSTPEFSIYYHTSTFLSKGYCYPNDWRYNGTHLGDKASGINVKYASDPYWGEKAAGYCWSVDKYLGSDDSNRYNVAIKDTYNFHFTKTSIKKEANSSSTTLYQTKTTNNEILTNYPIIVLDTNQKNGYYKIQSDAILDEGRTSIQKESEYSFSNNYAYINASEITLIHTNNGNDIPLPDQDNKGEILPSHKEIINHLNLVSKENYLTGFKLGTNVSTIISSIKEYAPKAGVEVKKSDNTIITSGIISTGMTITITTQNKEIKYTCIIRGDVSGDGVIEADDYMLIKLHVLGRKKINDFPNERADLDGDGKIEANDYMLIKLHVLGRKSLY